MSDPCEDICDALVEFLNSQDEGTYSLEFLADKPEDPNGELDKADDNVKVLFWPHGESEAKIGRTGQVVRKFSVAMLVLRKLSGDFTRRALSDFATEVMDSLRGEKMADRRYSTAETTKTDLVQLHEDKRLAVATILTYTGTC
jgi:hypothetical protein